MEKQESDPQGAPRGQSVWGTGSGGKEELVVRVGQGTGVGDIPQDLQELL